MIRFGSTRFAVYSIRLIIYSMKVISGAKCRPSKIDDKVVFFCLNRTSQIHSSWIRFFSLYFYQRHIEKKKVTYLYSYKSCYDMRLYKLELDKNVFKNYLIIIIVKLLYFFVFQGFKIRCVCVFFMMVLYYIYVMVM